MDIRELGMNVSDLEQKVKDELSKLLLPLVTKYQKVIDSMPTEHHYRFTLEVSKQMQDVIQSHLRKRLLFPCNVVVTRQNNAWDFNIERIFIHEIIKPEDIK